MAPRETGVTLKVNAGRIAEHLRALRRRLDLIRSGAVSVALLDVIDETIADLDTYAEQGGDECHAGPLAIRAKLTRARRDLIAREAEQWGYAVPEHVVHVLKGETVPDCTDCVGDMDEKP